MKKGVSIYAQNREGGIICLCKTNISAQTLTTPLPPPNK